MLRFVSFGLKVSENDENKVVSLSASYLIYLFYFFFHLHCFICVACICFTSIYFYHECICLKICFSVCLRNTLAAGFLSRCFTLISSLWLLLGLLSQSDCWDGPHLSLSQLQLPGAPVSLCPPGIKAYSRGDVCILRTPEGTVTWQTQDLSLRRPMCIEVLLTAAADYIQRSYFCELKE